MKKISAILLSIFTFVFVIALSDAKASAASEPFFARTLSAENIYKGATVKYAVAGTAKASDELLILSSFQNSGGESWYRVRSKTVTGWVPSSKLKVYGINALEVTSSGKSTVILKGADAASYSPAGTLSSFETAFVIGSFVNKKGEKWVRVTNFLIEGIETGWVKLDDLKPSAAKTSISTKIIYGGAPLGVSATAKLDDAKDYVKYGNAVKIIGGYDSEESDFPSVRIAYGKNFSKTGWIGYVFTQDAYADAIGESVAVPAGSVLKSSATDNSRTVASFKKDTIITIHDMYFTVSDFWFQVSTSSGVKGWLKAPGE
ncbi:hypothetical protein LRR81_19600 [Metabacillus sp. GX 13764]|uniref:GW dipeptide domain-containing protein n=1 Tax=Metabacillus kandeliae TaxID=2900151 RepID=UPI001E496CC0|nr:GW dipeptide domain-containing protein [Metabacillus kandeliae]MCD7036457.1 hypothetical protein [Metabacillus kandeliae]